ncbi:MAG: hypothetical protein LBI82_01045 [Dysgonamonadaceae bacterium]|jgi:hypothetical protein|nr:hypothetical protein [Dysgonamonadaceae bacterium]
MTEELIKYEQSVKRKHSFAWTPKFEEEFYTNLNKTLVIAIAIKTFEKLEWDVVYQDEESAEAKRKKWNQWTEKITVSYNYGKVKVKSVSLGNEMWDMGRNSLRVKLFIHAFAEVEKEFDKESLANLEKEVERANNLDDYVIPTELPQPKERKNPNIWIPIVGATFIALLLGYTLAFLSVEVTYIIFLFEVLIGLALAFAFKYLVKLSNYADFSKLKLILVGSIIIVYVSNQYFQYQIITAKFIDFPINFFDFMKIRLEQGFYIKSLNTGWIGFVVVWIIQLVLTYWISMLRFAVNLIKFQLERIPPEVTNFAYYHFVKGKTEEQVRTELSNMGWNEKLDQDEVFESIGALQSATEFNR